MIGITRGLGIEVFGDEEKIEITSKSLTGNNFIAILSKRYL